MTACNNPSIWWSFLSWSGHRQEQCREPMWQRRVVEERAWRVYKACVIVREGGGVAADIFMELTSIYMLQSTGRPSAFSTLSLLTSLVSYTVWMGLSSPPLLACRSYRRLLQTFCGKFPFEYPVVPWRQSLVNLHDR